MMTYYKKTPSLRGGTTRQSHDDTKINKITPVIVREVRPRQPHDAVVINKRAQSITGKDTMWQPIRNYGIFRRLPRRGAPRNDGVFIGVKLCY